MAEESRATRRCAYRPIPLEALETIADAFLLSTQQNEDYPAYSEDQLRRKRQRASYAEEHFEMLSAARDASQSKVDYALDHAGLTQDERTVWEMYSEGYTASQISRFLRISRPTTVRLLKSAGRRIAARDSITCGWEKIYNMEVRKRIYRKPMHCAERPCRRLGYCRYALRG